MTRIHDMGGRFGDGPIPLKKIDGKVVDNSKLNNFENKNKPNKCSEH